MEPLKKLILDHIGQKDYKPVKLTALAKEIGITENEWEDFRQAFDELKKQGKVAKGPKNLIAPPDMAGKVIGKFQANKRGFGFVIPLEPNSHGDLFIAHGAASGAMTGDIVAAKPMKKGYRNGQVRYHGIITEIIDRGYKNIVGQLKNYDGEWYVEPDGSEFVEPIEVEDISASGAKQDDKVQVEIISYPAEHLPAQGVITKILGKAGMYDAEIESIMIMYELPHEFEQPCIDQARQAAKDFDPQSAPRRDDITDEMIITIDPPDAKDFDDAISIKRNSDGNWVLGIHIADVSEFVGLDSPLDKQARERGNSVYLPGKVVPMLPEILSNGICSLQPDQQRFAKTAYITYDNGGEVLGTEFANSIIKSKARLTYEQADRILKGDAQGVPGPVVALLKDMETLAGLIEKRRRRKGMIHLDLPEIELVMDDQGKVVDAHPADDSYPHTIIEMFMVEANEAVARTLDRFGVPFIRRIHPDPDTADLSKVTKFVKICGIKIPKVLDRAAIQDLLKKVKGKPYEYAVNIYILRSFQRAEYSPSHVGHFALASTHYCHFTSPIRRYADLTIHRLINCYIEGTLNKIGLEEVLPEMQLREIGKHISFTEQQATQAERELKMVLILQMLEQHVGQELNCVITGLTGFGIFAQCKKFGIEGLIEFGDLGMDEWKYDDAKQAVVGRHSGKSVYMGMEMKVRIASVNVAGRHLYLAPAEKLVTRKPNIKSVNSPKKRRKKGKKSRA